jgi:multidrug efflux pump
VLAAQYESWSLPLAVILVVPMCVLSSVIGVALAKQDINIFTQVGFVVLIGLACKNAILIVEFAKAELEKGESVVTAALNGARVRLRPILMTSFAFIFGLFPLWNALGAGGKARQLIGTVTITGMIFSSAFAIFLVPVLFVLVERISNRLRGERVETSPTAEVRSSEKPAA